MLLIGREEDSSYHAYMYVETNTGNILQELGNRISNWIMRKSETKDGCPVVHISMERASKRAGAGRAIVV